MGFSIEYQLPAPVSPDIEAVILDATESLRRGRTWLICEPPFLRRHDGDVPLFFVQV